MARYIPTEEEAQALRDKGWYVNDEGWCWYQAGDYVPAKLTYRQALKEQKKGEKKDAK